MRNLVAIVGRPNVGKSTLFNRLTQTRQAIVYKKEGTTRDRQYGQAEWCGQNFLLVDTGGWFSTTNDIFRIEINKQVKIAIEEADVVLFLVDVRNGITDLDLQIATILRKKKKPVILGANKVDNYSWYFQSAEFYTFGLGSPYPISAINGSGTGELLDVLISKFIKKKENKPENDIPSVAIVGRPNVGKSSLINAFIEENRNIVTDIAGTTRDSIYTLYNKFGLKFYLVDTAGIRKKSKIEEDIEYYSVVRAIRAIEYADICVLLIDAMRGIEKQDIAIFSLIKKYRKGLIIAVNKWDLVENKEEKAIRFFKDSICHKIAPFVDIPIIFSSAKTKNRIYKILEMVQQIYEIRKLKIPTHQLNDILLPIITQTPPPIHKGKIVRIKYVTQLTHMSVPSFVFFCNLPQWIKEPYKKFLEKQLRSHWKLTGMPINLFMRKK